LTASVIAGIQSNPAVPPQVASTATVQLAPGVPFISDADLDRALLEAGVPATTADAVVEVNANARIEALRVSLAVLAVLAAIAIFMTRLLPTTPAGRPDHDPATD
jgi:hypothetical protein